MFDLVNLLFNTELLLTDYVEYTGYLLFFTVFMIFLLIILSFLYYALRKYSFFRITLMITISILVIIIAISACISLLSVLFWVCFLFASNLKMTIMSKFFFNEVFVNILSIFISFGMIFSGIGIIAKKGTDEF